MKPLKQRRSRKNAPKKVSSVRKTISRDETSEEDKLRRELYIFLVQERKTRQRTNLHDNSATGSSLSGPMSSWKGLQDGYDYINAPLDLKSNSGPNIDGTIDGQGGAISNTSSDSNSASESPNPSSGGEAIFIEYTIQPLVSTEDGQRINMNYVLQQLQKQRQLRGWKATFSAKNRARNIIRL